MALVSIILLMFLSNVRCALIVAINIPLALLFAFRHAVPARQVGQSAVDRRGRLRHHRRFVGDHGREHLSPSQRRRIRRLAAARADSAGGSHEVERSLFFSTAIMVCAFLPLFTMKGPEGQIFGPMADTYAFALGGALLLAVTLSPVLCALFLKNLKPASDNFLVRWLRDELPAATASDIIRYRWLTLAGFAALVVVTLAVLPLVGPRIHAAARRRQHLHSRHVSRSTSRWTKSRAA